MLSQDLLDILRCPADVRNAPNAGMLDPINNRWLVCRDCGHKYPIIDGIPVMLIDEQQKHCSTPIDEAWRLAQATEYQGWTTLKWDRAGTMWHLAYRAEAARLLERYVTDLKVNRSMDVGVGPAGIGFLSKFGPLDTKILGIEPLKRITITVEDQDLAQYVKTLQDRVRYVQAKGEDLPVASSSFDLVVCINVLDHTEMPARVLDSIRNCLKDRGILFLGVNIFSVLGRTKFESLRLVLGDKDQNFLAHPHSWTGKGMNRLLSNHGFRSIESTRPFGLKKILGKAEMRYWVCEKVSGSPILSSPQSETDRE